MPPKTPPKRPIAKAKGSDPTVSIASAAAARATMATGQGIQESPQEVQNPIEQNQSQNQNPQQKTNDDLKKLIETLKNKLNNNPNTPEQKKVPPKPKEKSAWNRSIANKENKPQWKPAYTVLTRISNHEKIPARSKKFPEVSINSVPHAFLYHPGVDGIKVDKLTIQAGKQIGIG